jgi:PTS system mannose-specific IIB component/fructoselysine and glucoselysine-specific PTS system IIB component
VSVVLFRVDERLIHGQVVVGWARQLRPRRIIVVDDALAEDALEQSIYRTGMPEGIDADFWSEAEAVRELPAVLQSTERAFVLTADLATMAHLTLRVEGIEEVNVGCIHHGGRRVLHYVRLDEGDEQLIDEMSDRGVRVVARDVPSSTPMRLGAQARG